MKLRNTNICLNDDELFEGWYCPRCGQRCYQPLTHWIQPLIYKEKYAPFFPKNNSPLSGLSRNA